MFKVHPTFIVPFALVPATMIENPTNVFSRAATTRILAMWMLLLPSLLRGVLSTTDGAILKFAASIHRQDKMLDAKPFQVAEGVTLTECLSLCVSVRKQPPTCMAFNYKNETCQLLSTYLCDPDRQNQLKDSEGSKYYDLMDSPHQEDAHRRSRVCLQTGRCSAKCPKYKLHETPKTFEEAQKMCESEMSIVAMPQTDQDHEELIALLKSKKLIRGWVGVMKINETFYYVNGAPFPPGFDKWGKEQPNNSGGQQDCAEMLQEMNFLWNDYECDKLDPFICQYVVS